MQSISPGAFSRLAGIVFTAALLLMPVRAAQETELKDETGKTILRYVIEVPPGIAAAGVKDPARQVGLILCSQEHDTPTGNDVFPVRQSLLRQGLLDGYVLVAPAPQGRKFGPADHEPIEKLISWAEKTYPVNPRRVYMYGKGEGSKISMEFMMMHPRLVTAAIGYSWGAWLMPSELNEPIDFVNSAPEIYLTLGRRDLAHHLSCVRDAYLRLREKGYHLIYREFDELGDRTYHPPSNDDALAWATRLRNKNVAPSAEEKKLLQAFDGAPPAPVNGYYPSLALVGGAPAGAVLQKLFESNNAAIREAAAETCKHGIFGNAATVALAKLVTDPSIRVRRSAIRALAMYANWRYAPAQKALIELATNQNADPRDRLNAADAIGYALRLQVKGARQDPPMFRALVALLQDKEEPIRAAAAGILAPLYEPAGEGAQRRRSPEGGWEKWLDEISSGQPVLKVPPGDPVSVFRSTLKSAEQGNVQAEAAVAMFYADGKGVQQNYAEAGKWWIKAAEGGDLQAARHVWNLYRNGEGVERNATIANHWAQVIGEPVQPLRTAPRATAVSTSK
jgi:TPR repeat protein